MYDITRKMATMMGGDHPSGKKEGSPIVTTTTANGIINNDSPISSLEDIAANAEQTIISIGDSIVTSLSEGFEILARSSEEVIFPRQAEEQRVDEQHEQMRIMQQKAEEDYKAAKQSLQKKKEEQEGHDDKKLSVLKKVSSFGKVPSLGKVSSFGGRVASFGRNNNRSSSSQKQQQPSSSSPAQQPSSSSNQLAPIYVKPPSSQPAQQQSIIESVVVAQQPVYVQETVTDNWQKPTTKMKKKRSLPRLKLFNR